MTREQTDGARRPSIFTLILWLLLIGGIVWVRVTDPAGDEGMINAITGLLGIPLLITFWLWIIRRSPLSRGLRRLICWGSIVALVGFSYAMRFDGFSGAMIPQFVPRFTSDGPELPPEEPVAGSEAAEGDETIALDLSKVAATDFPGFLGADRLGRVADVHLARDWSTRAPELLWKQKCGRGWSGFAVVNGVAITLEERAGEQLAIAYGVESGKVLWSRRYATAFSHFLGGEGPRSTPTIVDGAVVILGAAGDLLCLEGATGAVRWEHNLLTDYGVDEAYEFANVGYGRSNSPLVFDGRVVVPAGGVKGEHQAGLVAYDLASGNLLWESLPRNVSFSSPTLATVAGVRQILIINEESASGHDPADGRMLWEHPWPGKTPNDANCSQVMPIDAERVLLTKGYGSGASLLKLTPAADGELAVEVLWHSRRSLRTKFTNALLHGDHLYGLSDGILECVSLETGLRAWKGGRYGHGQMLLVEDVLLILSESGELIMVEASADNAANELGRFQVIEGKTWNNFALAGDLAVVRNAAQAAVVRLPLASD